MSTTKPITILVCGGRDFADRALVYRTLDEIKPDVVVHGACGMDRNRMDQNKMKGADRLADDWCLARGVQSHQRPADWANLGRRAGMLRNQEMLDEFRGVLDMVVAFEGGVGTAGMVKIARAAGIEVREVRGGSCATSI